MLPSVTSRLDEPPVVWFDEHGVSANYVQNYIHQANIMCRFRKPILVWLTERCMYLAALNQVAYTARSFAVVGFLMLVVFLSCYVGLSGHPMWAASLALVGSAEFVVCTLIKERAQRLAKAMHVFARTADMGPWRKDMQP